MFKINPMDKDILYSFLIKQAGVTIEELSDEALLEDDLGISGDDAFELIVAFGKEFSVDVSNFMVADYFSGEGDSILPAIVNFFTGRKEKKRLELRLKHLEKAMIAGRLDEEVINS